MTFSCNTLQILLLFSALISILLISFCHIYHITILSNSNNNVEPCFLGRIQCKLYPFYFCFLILHNPQPFMKRYNFNLYNQKNNQSKCTYCSEQLNSKENYSPKNVVGNQSIYFQSMQWLKSDSRKDCLYKKQIKSHGTVYFYPHGYNFPTRNHLH